MFGFVNIGVMDVLDILLVGLIIFYLIRIFKGSQARYIVLALLVLYLVRFACSVLSMKLTSALLGGILDIGLLALVVIFQPEIRRFLITLGSTYRQSSFNANIINHLFGRTRIEDDNATVVNEICLACEQMSEEKCGALIIIQGQNNLQYIATTGDEIDAKVSSRLLRNLFFKNSPLHDGAVIIKGDRVVAGRCTLPITERPTPASYGMRHKAAIGVSEVSDATVIVVSEETGRISVVKGGELTAVKGNNELKRMIQNG